MRSLVALSVLFWISFVAVVACNADEGLLSDATVNYEIPFSSPGLSSIEEPIFKFGDTARIAAFIAAMEATDLPKISPHEKKVYLASLKLADTMNRNQHQNILIAVALRWQSQGMTNPIATAWNRQWLSRYGIDQDLVVFVSSDQLDLLYKQVLIDQGMIKGQVDDKDVYKILYK